DNRRVALNNVLNAITLANETGAKEVLRNAYLMASDLYFSKQNYEKAYVFHRLYSSVKDSLVGQQDIEYVRTKYDQERKQHEIGILKKEQELKDLQIYKQQANLDSQKLTQNAFIVGFGLVLGLIILIYFAYRQKKKANILLEQRNNELYSHQLEIKEKNEQLENANGDLKDFASVVSHDLKAPLRGIGSLAGILQNDYEDKLGQKGKEMFDMLFTRVDRMQKLISGVLNYSKQGSQKIKKVKIPLNKLVPEIIDMLGAPDNYKIEISDTLPEIMGEPTQISQIFQNLVSNAIKYNTNPDPIIEISCSQQNGDWRFCISDNGPGIEEQYHQKIFQMFQKLGNKNEYESTGIGLALVNRIVRNYGGRVWVESKPGKGSDFIFTLPAN
ncbi:MAG: GHKL domain-containing protein, partial [Bacteroidetes bacterium]|nr:GHKL domain-containing protein [Bacteroidota bacterium]